MTGHVERMVAVLLVLLLLRQQARSSALCGVEVEQRARAAAPSHYIVDQLSVYC